MEEKIKISMPGETVSLLKKDCEDFKVLKDSGTPNMNAFINTLVVNYFEEFSASEEKLHDEIKTALFPLPEAYKNDTFNKILKILSKRGDFEVPKGRSASLSFKPTKSSEKTVVYIENVLLKNESISSFYRRMLLSYSKKTKNEREKIIYKDELEMLEKAISKGNMACVILKNGSVLKDMSVYAVSSSKDELFNYVLMYDGKNNVTIRLATVKGVSILPSKSKIPENNAEMFKRQIECGAQYPIYPSDSETIKVQLSERGKKLFQKIYLYRPTPIKIEGDVYHFNCSKNQALYYFERFGDSALILSPKKLGIEMRNYHYYALKKYRTRYNKE